MNILKTTEIYSVNGLIYKIYFTKTVKIKISTYVVLLHTATFPPKGCTNLHSCQQCKRGSVSYNHDATPFNYENLIDKK